MQDIELFLSLAEIAGVFVGFGALIALRSGAAAAPAEVALVGMVAWLGVQVVGLAMAPVVISRFGVTGHGLWVSCSLIALVVFWVGDEVVKRMSPERQAMLAALPTKVRVRLELIGVPFWLPMNVALVLVVLGVLPDQEAALYFAALVSLLLFDAVMVLALATSGPAAWKTTIIDAGGDGPA